MPSGWPRWIDAHLCQRRKWRRSPRVLSPETARMRDDDARVELHCTGWSGFPMSTRSEASRSSSLLSLTVYPWHAVVNHDYRAPQQPLRNLAKNPVLAPLCPRIVPGKCQCFGHFWLSGCTSRHVWCIWSSGWARASMSQLLWKPARKVRLFSSVRARRGSVQGMGHPFMYQVTNRQNVQRGGGKTVAQEDPLDDPWWGQPLLKKVRRFPRLTARRGMVSQ